MGNNSVLSSPWISLRVLIGAILAGSSAWITSYPFDFIKTLQQAQPIYTKSLTIKQIIKDTLNNYGFKGFYRGLTPCLIRSIPVNIANLWVYEGVLQLLK